MPKYILEITSVEKALQISPVLTLTRGLFSCAWPAAHAEGGEYCCDQLQNSILLQPYFFQMFSCSVVSAIRWLILIYRFLRSWRQILPSSQDGLKLVGVMPEVSFIWLKSYTLMETSQIGPHQRTSLSWMAQAEMRAWVDWLAFCLCLSHMAFLSNYFGYLFVSLNPNDAVCL